MRIIILSLVIVDHFVEGEHEDLLRTMCVVDSTKDVREDDVTAIKIFR